MSFKNSINNFKAYIKKEYLEGKRTHKFLVLAIGFLFFAILDPVMLKFLPEILKNQMQGIDLSSLYKQSQTVALANFSNDVYQISTLVVVFSLMGILSGERSAKTLTIPVSMGGSTTSVLLSKILVFGITLMVFSIAAIYIAYAYAGVIFGYDTEITVMSVLRSGTLIGIYFIFLISILSLYSSLFKKSFMAGICTLLTVYILPILSNFKDLKDFLPTNLISQTSYLQAPLSSSMFTSLITTVCVIVIINIITAYKLKHIDYI